MKACVLVATESDAPPVAKAIEDFNEVQEAFPVLGRREVVVRADVRGLAHLAELIDRITATKGVIVSETLLEIPQVVH